MEFLILYLVTSLVIAVAATTDIMYPALHLLKEEHYPMDMRYVRAIYMVCFFVISFIAAPMMLFIGLSKNRTKSFILAFHLAISSNHN